MRGYVYAGLAVAALALVAYAAHSVHEAGKEAGKAACLQERANVAAKTAVEVDRRDVASASASDTMLSYLAANMPPIELKTHEAAERVRTVYRDRSVPVGCTRPAGVQDELDAARARVNAAAAR